MTPRPVSDFATSSPHGPSLFVLDVDGTLLTSEHEVSRGTRSAVARTRRAGADVILASSRPPGALEPIARHLGLVAPAGFIASQGAVLGSFPSDGPPQIAHRESISIADARFLAREAVAVGVTLSWFTTTDWFVSDIDDDVRREAAVVGLTPVLRDLRSLEDPPDKMMLMSVPDQPSAARRMIELPAGVHAQRSNPQYLEITRRDVDKSTALRRYCADRSVAPSAIVAIGDGLNDLALFAYAGVSVAPANAHPKVLQRATFLTKSNDEDGVAHALTALMGLG